MTMKSNAQNYPARSITSDFFRPGVERLCPGTANRVRGMFCACSFNDCFPDDSALPGRNAVLFRLLPGGKSGFA
jgi:hypothetical protein